VLSLKRKKRRFGVIPRAIAAKISDSPSGLSVHLQWEGGSLPSPMATVETPAAAGVSTFAPFLRARFQTGVRFTMNAGIVFSVRSAVCRPLVRLAGEGVVSFGEAANQIFGGASRRRVALPLPAFGRPLQGAEASPGNGREKTGIYAIALVLFPGGPARMARMARFPITLFFRAHGTAPPQAVPIRGR
jgi:hypothetical protein